jgi:hypothetical protein
LVHELNFDRATTVLDATLMTCRIPSPIGEVPATNAALAKRGVACNIIILFTLIFKA